MNFDLPPMKEVEELLKVPIHLDSNRDFYIRLIFGNNHQIPIYDKFSKMLSTEEMMLNAGREILKFQQKGFLTLSEKTENPEDVFKRNIYAQKAKETSNKPKVDKTIKLPTSSEPFQKFWLSSFIVVKTIHEIRGLPYYDHYDKYDVEQKFIDQVSSITRLMKHDGLLDENKQTKNQLYSTMKHFVIETMRIRSNLLSNYIKTERIDFKRLNDSQKKEFASFEPKKKDINASSQDNPHQVTKQEDFDMKMLNHINATTIKLPNLYKYSGYCADEASRVRVKKQMSDHINKSSKLLMELVNRPPPPTQLKSRIPTNATNDTFIDDEYDGNDTNGNYSVRNSSRFESNLWRRKCPMLITNPTEKSNDIQPISVEVLKEDKKLSDQEVHTNYWKDNDPLECTRTGEYISQLDKINEFTSEVELDGAIFDTTEIEMPFLLTSEKNKPIKQKLIQPQLYKPVVPTKEFLDSFSSQFEIEDGDQDNISKNEEGNNKQEEEEDNQEEEENNDQTDNDEDKMSSMFSTSVRKPTTELENRKPFKIKYDIGNTNKDDMKFLMEQTKELKSENTGCAVHDKLDQIWEKLGFSISQKLEMVVKYSKDVEESSKMHEALSLWETALAFSEQYENCYTAMKDFLKLEAANASYAAVTIANMKEEMSEIVDSLKQVAGRLRQSYNDELIINRKSISQLVNDHQIKLRFLCKDLNIDFDCL